MKKCSCGADLEKLPKGVIRPCSKLCRQCCINKSRNKSRQPIQRRSNLKRSDKESVNKFLKRTQRKQASQAAKMKKYIVGKIKHDLSIGRDIRCIETGTLIPHHNPAEVSGMCVSHVLAGAQHRPLYWIYDSSVWMTPEVHGQWERGDRESMKCYDEMQERIAWLRNLSSEEIEELSIF